MGEVKRNGAIGAGRRPRMQFEVHARSYQRSGPRISRNPSKKTKIRCLLSLGRSEVSNGPADGDETEDEDSTSDN